MRPSGDLGQGAEREELEVLGGDELLPGDEVDRVAGAVPGRSEMVSLVASEPPGGGSGCRRAVAPSAPEGCKGRPGGRFGQQQDGGRGPIARLRRWPQG